MTLSPSTRLGPDEVTAHIGVGTLGEVYRTTDANLKRQIAIKMLLAAVPSDPDRLTRFPREAEVLAALSHPNIAHSVWPEKSDGPLALVLELVEGPALAGRVAKPMTEALGTTYQHGLTCRAMAWETNACR